MVIELSCTCDPVMKDGHHFSRFIAYVFHQCYYTPIELTSFILGLLNIVCWLVAQVPQVIQNFVIKDGGALSTGFMVMWLVGDATNLIGCIFTNQLPTQLYVSVYYCCMDIILLSQMFGFYFCRKHHLCGLKPKEEKKPPLVRVDSPGVDPNMIMTAVSINSDIVGTLAPETKEENKSMKFLSVGALMTGSSVLAILTYAGIRSASQGDSPSGGGGRVLADAVTELLGSIFSDSDSSDSSSSSSGLPLCNPEPDVGTVGRIMGDVSAWVCFVCYFFGRVPQIILNYKRKDTEGLSMLMFLFAILANIFYGTSIVIMPIDVKASEFWEATLPYILGSYGCVIPSLVVLWQFFRYRNKKDYSLLPIADPNEDESNEQQVDDDGDDEPDDYSSPQDTE